jgi:hypothetical protein
VTSEQKNIENTYAVDFFEVEVNETDLNLLNDEISANHLMDSEVMHGKDNATYQATEFHGREGRYLNRTGNQRPPKL